MSTRADTPTEASPPHHDGRILLAIVIAKDEMGLKDEEIRRLLPVCYPQLSGVRMEVEEVARIYQWCKKLDYFSTWDKEEKLNAATLLIQGRD